MRSLHSSFLHVIISSIAVATAVDDKLILPKVSLKRFFFDEIPAADTREIPTVPFTSKGSEWDIFPFYTTMDQVVDHPSDGSQDVTVDIMVRVASLLPTKFQLEVWNDQELGPIKIFQAPGLGWDECHAITWRNVGLDPTPMHSILMSSLDGLMKLCSISVTLVQTAPFTARSLADLSDYHDTSVIHKGDCNNGPLDAQHTSDLVCILRDNAECNIGWTEPTEWASYNFQVLSNGIDDYDVWVRLASRSSIRSVRVELVGVRNETFTAEIKAPGKGWQAFRDVLVFDNIYLEKGVYTLKIIFTTGWVNLCSVGVKYSTERHFVAVPATINALDFADYYDTSEKHRGNCGYGPVDAKRTTSDSPCTGTGDCHIAFTEPGEYVVYQFETNGQSQYVDITVRVASLRSDKEFRVQIGDNGPNKTFAAPGKGWQQFENVVWKSIHIGQERYHKIWVFTTTGQVNLCSVSIDYSTE